MAPAEGFSAPGVASYDSNTMTVGDGTWDFEKNTFLLPNLVGLNFDTMRYNGMGNRFSTVTQYHTLILAHGVMGAIVFLLLVPVSVLTARFYTRKPGYAIPYHAQIQILAALLLVAVFTLGWFAVGPERSWTNPHHAIGLAIFIMFLLQIIGGRLVRNIKGRSLRKMFHRWSGRLIALLGLIQVPLGLTLYGSPKYTFILYSLWVAFLLLLYFFLSYRAEGDHHRGRDEYISGGRSEGPSGITESEYYSDVHTEKTKGNKWIAPLAIGATIAALFSRKKKKDAEKELKVIGSRRGSASYLPSRRGSASYYDDEKYTEVDSRREEKKGGGFMQKLLGAGAIFGAGKLLSNMTKRKDRRTYDEEYSAVSTETPRRRPSRSYAAPSEFTDYTDWTEDTPPPRRGPRDGSILPPPGNPVMAAQALSAAESRTHPPPHARTRSQYSFEDSEYSSYVSPSRRKDEPPAAGGAGKGILAGLGLGWLAKKLADRKSKRAEEQRLREEEEMRSGMTESRYTGDGFSSPSRDRRSRRASGRPPRPPMSALSTEITQLTESSELEPRPPGTGYGGPPMPPLSAGPPPRTPPGPGYPGAHSRTESRHDVGPVGMPPMPSDPQGILHRESDVDAYGSPSGRPRRRDSSSRRRAGEEAAAAAVASASALAAREESRRRAESERMGASPSQPVSVKVRVHDDKDRNVTLRRLTEEEAAAARRDHRRRRGGSVSSLSGTDVGSGRRYRRDSSQRRSESVGMAEAGDTLAPPNPAFAVGRKPKDSAYYSGAAGPAGSAAGAGPAVSSIGSEHTYGAWSQNSGSPSGPAVNPVGSAAADNRRRRRQERRRSSASRPTGADMFD
ncbi:hypothetical protein Cob_v008524 [Colletotrichum orbiculare MAFF 240422]|uniref:Cytochrome b561 domain-containing protein n=1 Tax=Colletotrichum orbiculare (strain 104-T / ATCC 96160 / CBS 514.97 / LARS 414 / MAFF 240422) TaxID=1213857 RepID=A0A484FKG0_COLOR|nr:hypothetical protein Cob_v008524 [Colletotrichum orbiculare MAFF 240422]